MSKQRMAALTLVAGLAALPFGGPGAARADALEEIRAAGTFTVATEARFPPFEFVENGEIVGYSQDMMERILRDMPDVALERLDLPWPGILPGLAAGRFPYVVTSVTATQERAAAYHLSLPIADATVAVLKRAGDDRIASPQDLAGLNVGSQTGSAQLAAAERLSVELAESGGGFGALRDYVDFNEAYADLGAGRLDAVVNSLPNLLEAAKQRPDVFEVVQPTFGPKAYFVWAGIDDENHASLNAFMDEGIRKLNESGELATLQEKWFGAAMELPADVLPEPAN